MQAAAPQLPLALRYPPDQRLDTFHARDASLVAQLRAFAIGDGNDRALLLAGPAGTGKSHLALAVCADADAAGQRAGYLPLASAAGRLDEALESLHTLDLVALDGVETVAGHRDDEVALFHFHNRMQDAGRRLLYTSRAARDGLALVLPDLRSRLSQGTRITLERLDDDGRGEVLRLRARRRGLQVDDAAIEWLLRRSGREL